MIFNKAKSCIKGAFNFFGLDIRRSPQFEPYEWLKSMDIQTILDIGANTGQFASQFHGLFPDAKLYSFEPLENCYNELLKKMGRISNFRGFNFALGDINGEAEIYENEYTPSSSLLPMEELHKEAFPFTKHVTTQKIMIKRLDDIAADIDIRENILIKIDVQGTEDKVLLGGEQILSKASVLILETSFQPLYKTQPLFDDVYGVLKQKGFVYFGVEHIMRNPNDGSILQCDSIFIKNTAKSNITKIQ